MYTLDIIETVLDVVEELTFLRELALIEEVRDHLARHPSLVMVGEGKEGPTELDRILYKGICHIECGIEELLDDSVCIS